MGGEERKLKTPSMLAPGCLRKLPGAGFGGIGAAGALPSKLRLRGGWSAVGTVRPRGE